VPAIPSQDAVGADWLHEIKHDGLRIMARRAAAVIV
jgi:ATP-dependent DNA ligase